MSKSSQTENAVTAAAKTFWHSRQFWSMISAIVISCMIIGYLLGTWYATNAYKEASESRKVLLAQCLNNNVKLSSQLAAIGDKSANALQRLSTDRN